jgi:hypothetical protein
MKPFEEFRVEQLRPLGAVVRAVYAEDVYGVAQRLMELFQALNVRRGLDLKQPPDVRRILDHQAKPVRRVSHGGRAEIKPCSQKKRLAGRAQARRAGGQEIHPPTPQRGPIFLFHLDQRWLRKGGRRRLALDLVEIKPVLRHLRADRL